VPELADIVTRKLCNVAYAVYAARKLALKPTSVAALLDQPWIGFDEDHIYMPGQHWLHEQLGRRPEIRVNNWLVLHDAVRAGSGLGVLPCYLADQDPALHRVGGVLAEASTEQFLLVHRDLRALPRVRAVMDALVELFQIHRSLLEGRGRRAVP
jgi:DNA-binding transcriptional LysR family regulator